MTVAVITGSSGLVGSELVARLDERGWTTHGIDNNDEPRRGDHICFISDVRSFRSDYPSWEPEVSLDDILAELAAAGER